MSHGCSVCRRREDRDHGGADKSVCPCGCGKQSGMKEATAFMNLIHASWGHINR